MPELPEVEITARRLDDALRGVVVSSVMVPGLNALRTFDPPVSAMEGRASRRSGGAGLFLVRFRTARRRSSTMSAGRLQLFDKRAGPRDRTSRVLLRLDGDGERELRLREFGTRQQAWIRLVAAGAQDQDEVVAALGPEAWPDPPELGALLAPQKARPLHAVLRDQRVIAGIGRSWVDEILWTARLSPFKRAGDLDAEEAAALRDAVVDGWGGAGHSGGAPADPGQAALPLLVHSRGGTVPALGTTLEAVHYESYVLAYCPQADGWPGAQNRRLTVAEVARFVPPVARFAAMVCG